MSCEHVEELLSAYLDNALTPQERVVVQEHTSTCSTCREILADYRRFDVLLMDMPRVSPGAELRDKIFSSPEYQELISITSLYDFRRTRGSVQKASDTTQIESFPPLKYPSLGQRLTLPQKQIGQNEKQRPHLVALPGGLQETQPAIPAQRHHAKHHHSRTSTGLRIMQLAIAACLLLTIGVGSLIGWNIWSQQQNAATLSGGITPPLGVQLNGPLPAGTRYVFFQNNALWSGSTDTTETSTSALARLTPSNVRVSAYWSVRPAFIGHDAGNMIAYIDMKQGRVHLIRSDGQSDEVIAQPLFIGNTPSASQWNTPTGTDILNSLAWSPDGSMLAFVAAPTGVPHLYVYNISTPHIQMIAGSLDGSIQSLNWSSDAHTQVLTWSVGTSGHITNIMQQPIETGATQSASRMLLTGDYAQASYNQAGSWLLLSQDHNIFTLTLNGMVRQWTSDGSASLVQWSPKHDYIGYLSHLNTAISTYHVINLTTGSNVQVASSVAPNVAPAWSLDEQSLLSTDGTYIALTSLDGTSATTIRLPEATLLAWNPANSYEAIITLQGSKHGLYLFDTAHKTVSQISKTSIVGPILWTEIS